MNIVDYTIWDISTGEVTSKGRCVEGKAVVPDGHDVYYGERIDGETHVFNELGEPVLRETPQPIDQEEAGVLVNRERTRRIEMGKDFDGIWLAGSQIDQTNLIGRSRQAEKLKAAGVTAAVIPFRDGLNIIHYLTPDQMIDLEEQGSYFVSLCYQASWAIKAMDPFPADYAADVYWP